jgi:hypothetical protein
MQMKPKGRVPGSTRAGGELFRDKVKYNRNKKYPSYAIFTICRACKTIRDTDEMHDLGSDGWVCDECASGIISNKGT